MPLHKIIFFMCRGQTVPIGKNRIFKQALKHLYVSPSIHVLQTSIYNTEQATLSDSPLHFLTLSDLIRQSMPRVIKQVSHVLLKISVSHWANCRCIKSQKQKLHQYPLQYVC